MTHSIFYFFSPNPIQKVTTKQVESEFWRLVHSLEENVMVQYGADIHAMEMGSGFPTKGTEDLLPEDEVTFCGIT